jgi:membrane protein
MFQGLRWGFALYVEAFPSYKTIYGTLSVIPIFLLWVYLSWLLVLVGAVTVAVMPQWRLGARRERPDDAAALYRALRLIELLAEARKHAQTPSAAAAAAGSGISEDDVEQLLEAMHAASWVRRVEPAGWVLACDLSSLTLRDVYRLFGVQPYVEERADGMLVRAAGRVLAEVERTLDLPLDSLLARDGEERSEPQLRASDDPPARAQTGSP